MAKLSSCEVITFEVAARRLETIQLDYLDSPQPRSKAQVDIITYLERSAIIKDQERKTLKERHLPGHKSNRYKKALDVLRAGDYNPAFVMLRKDYCSAGQRLKEYRANFGINLYCQEYNLAAAAAKNLLSSLRPDEPQA